MTLTDDENTELVALSRERELKLRKCSDLQKPFVSLSHESVN